MKPAIFSVPARVSRLLARWSALFLTAAVVQADPIPVTTIGFGTVSGAINDYYNGGTDAAGNSGPNVGITSTFSASGGWLSASVNPTLNVPSGFTTGFALNWDTLIGFRIRIFDGVDGTGTQLATQDYIGNAGTASLAFSGTAKSVRLERFSQPGLGYDNLTFGSTTIGTPVSEPPAVTTSAATGVTSVTATLNATINPAGTATTAEFEYGTTPSYGSTASITLSPNNGTAAQTVSANLSGLAASTTYYYRATAVNGVGTRNGSGLSFTTAAPPGEALHFDGIDDKVTIPHRAELNSLPLTVECWFKPTASGSGVSSIVNKYVASSGNGWAIHYAGGQVSGWYYALPGFVNTSLPAVPVSLNTWHHVAMVVETTGSKLYVDGVLASSAVWAGVPTLATTTQNVTLGEYAGNTAGGKFFPGAIDEVRIWNGARSLAEILALKDTEIASMPSCLMAYYKFSQGFADGVNTGVTALPDIANAFADNGTLANFALTGTTGNWTTGPTLTATTSTYAATPDINLVGNGSQILDGTTATATGNNTDFGSSPVGAGVPKTFTLENTGTSDLTVSAISFSGANPGDYAVSGITLPATVAASGSTTFTVTFTPAAAGARTATVNVVNDDCDESNYDFALTGIGTMNNAPTVTRSLASITSPEGSTAANSGTFSDAQGNATVTLSASAGTITQDNGLGTWSWSYSATDGPDGPTTVTITATDNGSPALSSAATFTLSVNNVAPKLNQCAPPSFTLVNTTIPGWAAAPGDLDGDGDQDIVMGYPGGGISPVPFRNNGNGTFTQMPTLPGAARVVLTPLIADFNGDGKLDIAVDQSSSYRLYYGNGALQSSSSISVGSGGFEASGAVADLNADGRPDLVIGTNRGNSANDGNVSIRLNNGTGGFPAITQHLIGPGEIFVATADFNGDGKPDIAAADSEANTVTVLLNNGTGTFTPGTPLAVGTAPKQLTTGDVNNDGFQDIIVPNSGSGTVSVLLGNGTGGFAAASSYAAGAGAKFVLAADFNNDGVLDLGVALASGVALLPANGGGTFGASTAYGVGFTPINITLADMNADGGQDILVGFSDTVRYLRANVAPATVTANEGSTAANSGTFCDPGADTVTITASIGTVTQNNGAGTWTWSYPTTDGPTQNTPVTITATDSDGGTSAYTFNLVVANLNPTATFANGGAVSEGGTGSVTFSSPADAGAPDTSAGFHYAYDFNNDGTFDSGDGTYAGSGITASATVPATYLADGAGSRVVKGRILDKDGGFTDYTTTITINNVAPTIALTGDPTVANGAPYTLNLGAITDPGADTVSAFSINWGDGNTENFTGSPASTTKTHTYSSVGAKTITVTLTDEDGAFTGGTQSVTVENAAPVAVADGLNRPNTTTVAKVLKATLLANDTDADLDPLTLTAVGNALPAGATVTMAGGFVVYTAPANNAGNGSFTYTLSDGTHTVTGTVTVTETSTSGGGGGTPNYLTLVPSGDDFVVTFLGVPGGSFRVQYSTAGPPNYDWQEFASPAIYTAAPNGVFTHTDVNPPGPVRFYRAVSNP